MGMHSNYEKQKLVFRSNPSNASAGDFMRTARELEAEGELSDDQFLDDLAEINDYLSRRK